MGVRFRITEAFSLCIPALASAQWPILPQWSALMGTQTKKQYFINNCKISYQTKQKNTPKIQQKKNKKTSQKLENHCKLK